MSWAAPALGMALGNNWGKKKGIKSVICRSLLSIMRASRLPGGFSRDIHEAPVFVEASSTSSSSTIEGYITHLPMIQYSRS